MGFYFRKRLNFGPLRLNLSKSGVGLSTGIRGLRAGVTAHGQMFSSANLPGTGLYYRKVYTARHAGEPVAHAVGFAIGVLLPFVLILAIAVWVGGLLR